MSDRPDIDWLDPDEDVYYQAKAVVLIQEVGQTKRRRARGLAMLTDRRVIVRHRGAFFVDVARPLISAARSLPSLRTATAYYQPLPGRRVLRLVVESTKRDTVIGIVLRTQEAAAWQDELAPGSLPSRFRR